MGVFAGLSHGCASTEADVWLYNGTLYVRYRSILWAVKLRVKLIVMAGWSRAVCSD